MASCLIADCNPTPISQCLLAVTGATPVTASQAVDKYTGAGTKQLFRWRTMITNAQIIASTIGGTALPLLPAIAGHAYIIRNASLQWGGLPAQVGITVSSGTCTFNSQGGFLPPPVTASAAAIGFTNLTADANHTVTFNLLCGANVSASLVCPQIVVGGAGVAADGYMFFTPAANQLQAGINLPLNFTSSAQTLSVGVATNRYVLTVDFELQPYPV